MTKANHRDRPGFELDGAATGIHPRWQVTNVLREIGGGLATGEKAIMAEDLSVDGGIVMNWDAVGAIGEIVGAGAVVATLAFLAVQLRDGKRVQLEANTLARSAAVDKAYERFSSFRRLLAADPDATCADGGLQGRTAR